MTTDPSAATYTCVVCGEAVEAAMSAECHWCDRRYHLNQRNDIEANDCGRVWIDEQHLGLMFACNSCIAKESASESADETGASPKKARPAIADAPRARRYKRRA